MRGQVSLAVAAAQGRRELTCSIGRRTVDSLGRPSVVRLESASGRVGLARTQPGDRRVGEIGVPPLLRRALKLFHGESVTVTPARLGPLTRVIIEPEADLSALDVGAVRDAIKRSLIADNLPVFAGLLFYSEFPGGGAGTTFRVIDCPEGGGIVDDATDVEVQVAYGARVTDAMRDASLEDIGGLRKQLALARELVELPLRDPAVYRSVGVPPVRGVLFVGP